MTTYAPAPKEPEERRRNHSVALWAGLTAFFTNMVAFKVLSILASGDIRIGLSALLTSFCVAGSVYTKQRLDEAKREEPT